MSIFGGRLKPHQVALTGAEYKEFMRDEKVWDDEAHMDDVLVYVDGEPWGDRSVFAIPDGAVVVVDTGSYYPHGDAEKPMALTQVVRDWLKVRTTAIYAVEFPKYTKIADIEAAVAPLKGRIARY